MKEIAKKINGFKINVHGDAYDHDKAAVRIFNDDSDIVIVKFNNMKNRSIVWESRLGAGMPIDMKIQIIKSIVTA